MKMFNLKKLSWKIAFIVSISVLIVAGGASAYLESLHINRIKQISGMNMQLLMNDVVKESNLAFTEAIYKTESLKELAESIFDINEYRNDAENYFDNNIKTVMSSFSYDLVDKSDYIMAAYFAVHPDLAGYPLVNEVYFEKTDGGVYSGEPQTYDDYMQKDDVEMEWFYGAYGSGKPYWTPIHVFDGETMVSYVEPVVIDGVIIGVAGVDIPIAHIIDLVKDIKAFDTGFALLEDNYNEFVKSSDFANRLVAEDERKLKELSYQNPNDVFEIKLYNAGFIAAQSNLINEYAVYVLVPQKEFNAESIASVTRFVVLFLIVFIAVIFISLYIGKSFSAPLIALSAFMTKASSTGDITLSQEDVVVISKYAQYKDEIGQAIASCAGFVGRITDVSQSLKTIATGDLTDELKTLSELDVMGNSLSEMNNKLNGMFNEIKRSAEQVSSGSKQFAVTANSIASSATQMASGAQALSDGAAKQTGYVEDLSRSMAEIADKTKTNAEITEQAAELAEIIIKKVEKGNRHMEDMVTTVNDITEASKSVSNIMETINGIASQTNLLSLNAAIEAARAGEHGKGFAVVAEEVRKLAAQSEESVKEISIIIQNSIQKAELGVQVADEMASSLAEIIAGINESSELIMKIAKASEEQFLSISRINNNVDNVAEIVQHNSALAEESAASAEENAAAAQESAAIADEMSTQSNILERLITQFKLKDGNIRP